MDHPMQQTATKTLGRYQLLQLIGKGGMGEVWLAEDPILHRQVAIKTLPTHSLSDREFSQRFEREAQAAASLNHPHILPVHDYGQQVLPSGHIVTYIVLPYLTGGSLSDRIAAYSARRIPMPAQEAISHLSQVAEAIDYAHEQGIIHRDIKPGNMLLRSDNWLMLADFGIARMLASSEQLTQQGIGIGTPQYMAPEQAQGKAEFASDNYSLAVIAYQLFTGHLPFQADTGYAITIQHMTMPPPPPRQLNPALSPAFETVLLHGLAKNPVQRLSSARTFVAELQKALTNAPQEATYIQPALLHTEIGMTVPTVSEAPETTRPLPNGGRGLTRRGLLIGGSAALLVVGGGIGAWAFTTRGPQQSPTATPMSTTVMQGQSGPVSTSSLLILRGHNKPVGSLAWSPIANMLASAGSGGEGQVLLWDIDAISQQTHPSPHYKAKQMLDASSKMLLAWSSTGNMLAIAGTGTNSAMNACRLSVYTSDLSSLATGYNDNFFVSGTSIEALAWAPSDYLFTIASAPLSQIGGPFVLTVWDFRDTQNPQRQLAKFNLSHSLTQDSTVVFNPLVIASHTMPLTMAISTGSGISVCNLDLSGSSPHWQEDHFLLKFKNTNVLLDYAGPLTWSPDGQQVAGIRQSLDNPTTISIWNIQNQTILNDRALPPSAKTSLISLAWNSAPSSSIVAAGGRDGKVYIWDSLESTLPQSTYSPPFGIKGQVQELAWSADGQWLAAAYDDINATILVWKI